MLSKLIQIRFLEFKIFIRELSQSNLKNFDK